jgi:hypothetical protein
MYIFQLKKQWSGTGVYCENQVLALPYLGGHNGHLDHQVVLQTGHPLGQPKRFSKKDHPTQGMVEVAGEGRVVPLGKAELLELISVATAQSAVGW